MSETHIGRRPFWRQPLVHFLAAGALIFAANSLFGAPAQQRSDKIVITVVQVERMAKLWQRTWGRAPSEQELQGLVREHIKEEVYYREAIKLGLDVNDTVIRRRLRQKMEFLSTGDAEAMEPDIDALKEFYEKNVEIYRVGPVYSFQQVYFTGNDTVRIETALSALQDGGELLKIGDAISLPEKMTDADEADIARIFGAEFYASLETMRPGDWDGIVESGFGRHLVKITAKQPSKIPTLRDVRMKVVNDWKAQQRAKAQSDAFDDLREKYSIEIESPE